jgi:DsbC/DsbD-like thiol-disulfide interchange protein
MMIRFRLLFLTACMLGAAVQAFSIFQTADASIQVAPTKSNFKATGAAKSDSPAQLVTANSKTRVKATSAGWVKLAGGETAAVVRFEIENGWHMYWENPGDSGAPPLAQLSAMQGWTLLEPIFPRPSILKTAADTEFIYNNSWEWLLPIEGPAGASPPACSFDLSWMVCKENCEIGRARVEFAAAVGNIPPAGAVRLGRSIATMGATATFNSKDQAITISGDAGKTANTNSKNSSANTAQFIPAIIPGVSLKFTGPFQAKLRDEKFTLNIPIEIQPQNALGKPIVFKGLFLYGQLDSDCCENIRLPLNMQVSQP